MIQMDIQIGQYLCDGCGQDFITEDELREHQMNCPATRQTTAAYTCQRCDTRFDTAADLHDHEHCHEGVYF
jgi:DNA-directed RNA polymerase subunit RPC12/RpoP